MGAQKQIHKWPIWKPLSTGCAWGLPGGHASSTAGWHRRAFDNCTRLAQWAEAQWGEEGLRIVLTSLGWLAASGLCWQVWGLVCSFWRRFCVKSWRSVLCLGCEGTGRSRAQITTPPQTKPSVWTFVEFRTIRCTSGRYPQKGVCGLLGICSVAGRCRPRALLVTIAIDWVTIASSSFPSPCIHPLCWSPYLKMLPCSLPASLVLMWRGQPLRWRATLTWHLSLANHRAPPGSSLHLVGMKFCAPMAGATTPRAAKKVRGGGDSVVFHPPFDLLLW